MRKSMRFFMALGAFFAVAMVLAACGGGVSGNDVASVDGDGISKSDFNHWLAVASQSSQQTTGGAKPAAPDPPDFKNCIASKRKTLPVPPKGQKGPTDAQLKAQCQQEYNGLRDQVMQFLISAKWIQKEAKDQGVTVSDAEVKKQFAQTKKQSFPKEKDFQKFLKNSGMTMQDILFRVKIDQLSNKIREKVTKGKDKVTDAQIASYYAKNKKRFAQPQRRDLLVVLTKDQATAAKAKAAIASGQSWASVAKKYSVDQSTKSQGGKLQGVVKGQQEKALDAAVFKAQKGQLVGPIKTQFGWYDFKVTKVTPPSQQTLAQSKDTIKALLASQNQQTALNAFVKDFRSKWQGKTDCQKGYVTQDCKNAPKQKTTSTAAPAPAQQTTTG